MTNKPPKPPKPFPWKCHHCFKDEVVMGATSYDAEVRHDGRLHKFTIPHLHLPICQACGEKVFTEKVDDQIGAALRAHLHLLTPEEIRQGLGHLNITQKEATERLGIAEATLSRWLTYTQIQSRAMDNLLRIFFACPEVREMLGGPEGKWKREPRISDEVLDRVARRIPRPKKMAQLDECRSRISNGLAFAMQRVESLN